MKPNTRKLWIGHSAPVDYKQVTTDFINTVDTRIASSFYNRYDEINFTDTPISDFSRWPFVLDELFKISSGETVFTLRFNVLSRTFGLPKFYKQIYDLADGQVEILSLVSDRISGVFTLSFKATRRKYDKSHGWSFGILWDGKSEENVLSFINSIHLCIKDKNDFELIICGPKPNFEIDIPFSLVETDDLTEKLANISRKKNLIAKSARYENLCIVHNRYTLDDGFLKAFDDIEYDYDICIARQLLAETGERVPDWVSQASDQKLVANYLLPYGDYSPFMYVPGGIVIVKRHILLDNPFNELITWNMAEDVEWSQRLIAKSIIPRLISKASVTVLSIRKEILSDFKKPDIMNFYDNIDQFSTHEMRRISNRSQLFGKILSIFKLAIRNPVLFFEKLKNKLRRQMN
ncbi:hypothetical protein [Kluyvera georgiana]|uniref:hypothetical protein n=1 Tax=Kluyvera georgiana TaxID=73098 RepID=UPI00321F94F7